MANRILLVDDDPAIRDALGMVLGDEGYHVDFAEDGQAALEVLRNGLRPDVVLLDLMMPRMDGYQFRQHQLGDEQLRALTVFVLTAGSVDARVEALGAKAIFRKPLEIDDFLKALRAETAG